MRKKYNENKIDNCLQVESNLPSSPCCICKRKTCAPFDDFDICLMKKRIQDLEKENKKLKRAGKILLD